MKNQCKRDLAESRKNMIRIRNEAIANSQLRARERRSQSDVCGDEERKKFPGQKGSKETGLKERAEEKSGQIPASENETQHLP